MRAGLLKERIRFKEAVVTITDSGARRESWNYVHMCKAYIPFQNSNKQLIASEMTNQNTLRIIIRALRKVQDDWVLEYRGDDYKFQKSYNSCNRTYTLEATKIDK